MTDNIEGFAVVARLIRRFSGMTRPCVIESSSPRPEIARVAKSVIRFCIGLCVPRSFSSGSLLECPEAALLVVIVEGVGELGVATDSRREISSTMVSMSWLEFSTLLVELLFLRISPVYGDSDKSGVGSDEVSLLLEDVAEGKFEESLDVGHDWTPDKWCFG